MKRNSCILYSVILVLLVTASAGFTKRKISNEDFISYQVDFKKQQLKLYWKDEKGQLFRSLGNLKNWLAKNKQQLFFAMNAGMYKTDNSPLGLFIQDNKVVTALNTKSGSGNFYMKPNGVFYITTDNVAAICKTENFSNNGKIKYASQSGPMLVIDGKIHPAFTPVSKNVNIRNGVGILPNNKLIFAMSKSEVNFYEFAKYFKDLGCYNALYLDGFVSRTYLPEKNWEQTDGNFGVIVGVTNAP